MGIDPVTHEPLNNVEKDQKNSQSEQTEEKHPQPEAADAPFTSSKESSYSPADQNSSSDDNNLCENDPLISCLFRDDPLQMDFPWEFPSSEEGLATFSASSWDPGCQWLLDCQDFGVHDFGFECFNDFGVGANTERE